MLLSVTDFMDVRLRKLARLNDRLNLLSKQFNSLIEACLNRKIYRTGKFTVGQSLE